MKAYKLMRIRKDGTLGSLFINRKAIYPIGVWLSAKCVETKGFAVRPGWHCTFDKNAPHLSNKGRVWAEVEVKDYLTYPRPKSQGGTWILAKQIKIILICH